MSQIRLILADKDSMFLEKFSAYLRKNKATHFDLELYTNPTKLEERLLNNEKADLIAISSALFSEMAQKPEAGRALILGDSAESLVPEGYHSISKYIPAESLMKEIVSLCAESFPGTTQQKGHSGKVHLVLYADGSDAANPIAQAMAGIFAKNGKSTFYLNLDELSNTNAWFSGSNIRGLSEMLYYVKAQKENLSLRADSCISKDIDTGVDFMKGHKNPEDIGKLASSECEKLIASIRGRDYSHIVISRAFRLDELLPVLLKEADKIYLSGIHYTSSISRLSKAANLLSGLREQNNVNFTDKVLICVTPLRKEQTYQAIDIPDYPKAFLPLPYEEGKAFSAPSAEYRATLEAYLEKDAI